jgi:pantoate kinase
MKKVSAFVPGHISGFFQVCEASDLERKGSRNCGPCIDIGVTTRVEVRPSDRTKVKIFINDKQAPEAQTSFVAAEQILRDAPEPSDVIVKHYSQVPIGAGYGASGAGAFGVALALSKALGITISKTEAVRVAHIAEVTCGTGLGDVGAQMTGGLVIGIEPGAPPHGRWQRISVQNDIRIVCGTLGPLSTKELLRDKKILERSKKYGRIALKKLLSYPEIKNFVNVSSEFAESMGLLDDDMRALMEVATSAGAMGASMVMLGKAVFAPVEKENVAAVKKAFLKRLDPNFVLVVGIDEVGAKLI